METEVKENITESHSNNNLLRFILIIGISFAIGGLVAGLIMIPGLYHIIWGAIGGFGMGIATKKDKKLFILLGGLGFGIASIAMSYFWGTWAVIIGAVTIGILEGALLGLYYKNTKFIGILAIFGAFGFGVGSIIGTAIYNSTLDMRYGGMTGAIMVLISFMVMGLFGGAALGYGIYNIEKLPGR